MSIQHPSNPNHTSPATWSSPVSPISAVIEARAPCQVCNTQHLTSKIVTGKFCRPHLDPIQLPVRASYSTSVCIADYTHRQLHSAGVLHRGLGLKAPRWITAIKAGCDLRLTDRSVTVKGETGLSVDCSRYWARNRIRCGHLTR